MRGRNGQVMLVLHAEQRPRTKGPIGVYTEQTVVYTLGHPLGVLVTDEPDLEAIDAVSRIGAIESLAEICVPVRVDAFAGTASCTVGAFKLSASGQDAKQAREVLRAKLIEAIKPPTWIAIRLSGDD